MNSNLKEHQSVFKGIISYEYFSNHPGIALQDKTGFKIDLAARLIECSLNWRQWRFDDKYRVRIFIADEPQVLDDIKNQTWSYDIESDRFFPERSSYDVEYFSDWQETKYSTSIVLNQYDIMDLLKQHEGKWAYIIFSAYKIRVKKKDD